MTTTRTMPEATVTLDLAGLLAPISNENPAGVSLKYSGLYEEIREKRRADDDLPKGELKEAGKPKRADWDAVISIATDALTTKSKDLQVAVRLVEALTQSRGLPGLESGLRLLRGLIERYWETLHPAIEDGDIGFRIGPLEWLNSPLPIAIKLIRLTQPRAGEAVYTYVDWERAQTNVDPIEKERLEKAMAATSTLFLEQLRAGLIQCREELVRLGQVLDERCQADAPSFRGISETLEAYSDVVGGALAKRAERTGTRTRAPETTQRPNMGPQQALGSALPSSDIEPVDRADALRRLDAVAAYFLQTEPHSPVSYLVQRAAKWGAMPLGEWLQEVIKNPDVLGEVRETLGMKETDKTDES